MIGRNYPAYRPRRSFRKYYYGLFVLSVIFLWHVGAPSWGSPADEQRAATPLAARTSPDDLDDITEPSPLVHGGHVPIRPVPVEEDLASYYTPPPPNTNNQGPKTPRSADSAARSPKLAGGDEAEQHDGDTIEVIGEHRDDDKVQHAAELTHPDDDDGAMTDSEKPGFERDGQVPINGKTKSHALVDELLNADHPSKDVPAKDVESDTEDSATAAGPTLKEQRPIEPLKEQTPWSENYDFPLWDECQSVKEKADALPDLLHVPFEVSARDVILEGWEDEWVSKARYTGPQLQEPKIDFVYNCE